MDSRTSPAATPGRSNTFRSDPKGEGPLSETGINAAHGIARTGKRCLVSISSPDEPRAFFLPQRGQRLALRSSKNSIARGPGYQQDTLEPLKGLLPNRKAAPGSQQGYLTRCQCLM